ncbi:MAG TPA: phage holin family protein [Bryobacteraceae bacterium]|jgi:putative membrane protein|nr:phage holin family protein [Bryobacteraceae bacterium]
MLVHLIVSWLVAALALWLVAKIVEGIEVRNFGDALIATAVIAVLDVTIGPILRFLSFPLSVITLGLFRLVINAFLLMLASLLSPGFRVRGFLNALIGSLLLTILTWALNLVVWV